MTVMAIDTLLFARKVQKAGLDQKVAEGLAEAIKDCTSISTENIATKEDFQLVRNEVEIVNKDIKSVESSLRQEIKIVESSLRQEIRSVESSLRQEIKMVDSNLKQEIKISEQILTIRIGAIITAAIAIVTWINTITHH